MRASMGTADDADTVSTPINTGGGANAAAARPAVIVSANVATPTAATALSSPLSIDAQAQMLDPSKVPKDVNWDGEI